MIWTNWAASWQRLLCLRLKSLTSWRSLRWAPVRRWEGLAISSPSRTRRSCLTVASILALLVWMPSPLLTWSKLTRLTCFWYLTSTWTTPEHSRGSCRRQPLRGNATWLTPPRQYSSGSFRIISKYKELWYIRIIVENLFRLATFLQTKCFTPRVTWRLPWIKSRP